MGKALTNRHSTDLVEQIYMSQPSQKPHCTRRKNVGAEF